MNSCSIKYGPRNDRKHIKCKVYDAWDERERLIAEGHQDVQILNREGKPLDQAELHQFYLDTAGSKDARSAIGEL